MDLIVSRVATKERFWDNTDLILFLIIAYDM